MTQLASDMRAIITELGSEFVERREALEVVGTTLLAAQHAVIYGPPGVAKSVMLRAFTRRIVDAQYGEVLFDRMLPPEFVFGPVDLHTYQTTGQYHRDTNGYLPSCHVYFGDEIGKAGPSVLNPLLTVLNERYYHNNGASGPVPLISFFAASNEVLEPELAAIQDRFLVHMFVDDVQEHSNFMKMIGGGLKPVDNPTTIKLPDLQQAISIEVPAVTLPIGVQEAIGQLRSDLIGESIRVSPRRWMWLNDLLRAAAYLNGRSAVDDDDLAIAQHALWTHPTQIQTVQRKVLALTSPITRLALEQQSFLDEVESELNARKGQSLESLATYGGEAQFKLTETATALKAKVKDAAEQGRSTTKLEQVLDNAKALKLRVFVECLSIPADRAAKMVEV